MRGFDLKSGIIGALSAACVAWRWARDNSNPLPRDTRSLSAPRILYLCWTMRRAWSARSSAAARRLASPG